jgi:eukaryotic-like serine/threonine-protein kinase
LDLVSGKSLAQYRLAEKIGEGGMGVVWRAQDTTLGRDVAIKILPEVFAQDAERLERFAREAKLLASLSHPNVASIYGLHESGGIRFLAMELVPGEDLARRLERGALPVEEALPIARQVAEALEAAHDSGVVHRDLKPANIKISPDGRVKVLDFGLAKAFEPDATSGGPSLSPTLTQRATQAGVILGTAAYMSPEQARGSSVDQRADIWSFGVVLFEMLTGGRLFEGETVSDTLASVLKTEPAWEALPAATPPPIRRLLRRGLQKDSRRRLRHVGDAILEIDQALAGPAPEDAAATTIAAVAPASGGGWRVLVPIAVTAALAAAAGLFGSRFLQREPPILPLRKSEITVERLDTDPNRRPLISPDGATLLYYADGHLWLRGLADLKPRPLATGDRASYPFWSPDDALVGFFRDGKLWKAPVAGGEAVVVCTLPSAPVGGTGGAWRPDGSIVFSTGSGPLYEVPARGGDARVLHDVNLKAESDFHDPYVLPDGHTVVFVVHRQEGTDTLAALVDGQRRILLQMKDQRFSYPTWSPSGHLIYRRTGGGGGIWAVPFSAAKATFTGDPFLVAADAGEPSTGADGTLAYFAGEGARLHLAWVDRAGQVEGTVGQSQEGITRPRLSPDGTRVAVSALEVENRDIWVHDLARGTRTRLTFDSTIENNPAWNPAGDRVLFSRVESPSANIYMQPADGSGTAEKLAEGFGGRVSRDGRMLAYDIGLMGHADLMWLDLRGDRTASKRVETPAAELWPEISPDGLYLAYQSNESGHEEIYVHRFPQGEGRWQVSAAGGTMPRWSSRGNELFFVADDDLMVAEVQTQPALRLGTPQKLFSGRTLNLSSMTDYDVSPDGRRILVVQREGSTTLPRVTVVQNWYREFAGTK